MYVDAVSSFPDDARDPAHHFLPVSEHWLKRFLNTWSASPSHFSLLTLHTLCFCTSQERRRGFPCSGGCDIKPGYISIPFHCLSFPFHHWRSLANATSLTAPFPSLMSCGANSHRAKSYALILLILCLKQLLSTVLSIALQYYSM